MSLRTAMQNGAPQSLADLESKHASTQENMNASTQDGVPDNETDMSDDEVSIPAARISVTVRITPESYRGLQLLKRRTGMSVQSLIDSGIKREIKARAKP